ncbi:fibrinogen-like YCDxxxxGGGW domain-containing protein [Nocardioides albus]|nr:fibrinogen-like YCDxxxxGGGW domain-containing protein [Nocardioides albus]GGU41461.1 hypothetical protein GCM10007979_45890 [Nocardioides albus]
MITTSTPGRRRHKMRAVALPIALAVTTTVLASTGAAAGRPATGSPATDTPQATSPDATAALGSISRPAASCWEIKEQRPDAPSGTYWLWTPKLEVADQFYCDQETDGGGWVLIGRGREAWNRSDAGMGTTADVRKTITGPGAFAPRTLSAEVINGLYNGERADAQQMRLRRALDGTGTNWQETRYAYSSGMPTWSWPAAHGAETPVKGVTFDGATAAAGSNTVGWVGTQQSIASLYTRINAYTYNGGTWAHHKTAALPGASTASDSYVYHSGGWLNVPFTQVFSRPKVTSSAFVAVPEEGLAEARNKAVVRDGSLKNPWGVTGRSPLFRDNLDVEVQAFGEDKATGIMYVGGNFTTVQRDSSATDAATQQFLAAFDATTGEWIPTFRPELDGQVKSIEVLPGGRLAVGGEFSNADSAPHEGFVVLDKSTGRVHQDFSTLLVNRVSVETVSVWDIVTHDGWLYLGGKFTHATGPSSTREVYSRNIMRLRLDDLTPDRTFTAELNGGAVDLDIHNGRLYAAGTFSLNKGASAFRALAINLSDYTQVPWKINVSYGNAVLNSRQYGVVATDTSVWLTGAEHLHAAYDSSDLSLKQTWMQYAGGDGQTIASNGDTVFAGCHCWGKSYEGAAKWGASGTNFEEISAIGAYDAVGTTLQRTPKVWDPAFSSRHGDGAWASHIDSRGTLWVGGDFTHAVPHGWTSRRWTGGFVRFEQDLDAIAPAVPTGLSVVTDGTWDALSWEPGGEGVTYQVFAIGSGELVTQTTDTAVAVPARPDGTRYVVRALDSDGNISATSNAVVAQPGEISADLIPEASPTRPVQLISPRATWSHSHDAGRPDGWPAVEPFTSTGTAPLGWGTNDVATAFPAAADGTRPLASYYAKSFDLPADAPHQELVVTVRIDDGTAVYLNGKEVLRENLPDGELADRTYATQSVSGNAAPDNTKTVRIPITDLAEGTNTITAEVHSNWTKAPSSTFDLEAVLQ